MKDTFTAAGQTSKHAVSLASLLRIIFWAWAGRRYRAWRRTTSCLTAPFRHATAVQLVCSRHWHQTEPAQLHRYRSSAAENSLPH